MSTKKQILAYANRKGVVQIKSTPIKMIEAALLDLDKHRGPWASMSLKVRVSLLNEIWKDMRGVVDRWAFETILGSQIPLESPATAEGWMSVLAVFNQLRALRLSLSEIEREGRPAIPGTVERGEHGQTIVPVFPRTTWDRWLLRGVRGEVWMHPGVTPQQVPAGQAVVYRTRQSTTRITLVLGAGNQGFLVTGDVLHRMFVENRLVIVKMNPVNQYMGPVIERGFRALIKRGFLQVVYGEDEEAAFLIEHPIIDEIHMTGTNKTYNEVVYGPGLEGEERRLAGAPMISKRLTATLGSITPVIVVPGPWTIRDVQQQARFLCTMVSYNAGVDPMTPRLIVQHKSWEYCENLLDALRSLLPRIGTRIPPYPEAYEKHALFLEAHPEAETFGKPREGELPWTMIPYVNAEYPDIVFEVEPQSSLFAETAIDAPGVTNFLQRAVEFVNDQVWGSLACTLLVHPATLHDPIAGRAVEKAVADLRYGTIGVNVWAALGYTMSTTTWGAFPGNDVSRIESGVGLVNNMLMLEHPQKSVLYGPFHNSGLHTIAFNQRIPYVMEAIARMRSGAGLTRVPGALTQAISVRTTNREKGRSRRRRRL